MKKNTLFLFTILYLAIVPLFSLTGTVVSANGKVEIQTPTGWTPLKSGDTVEEGYVISTGFKSQVTIKVAGSNLVVNALSRLTLEQLTETQDAHESEFLLDLGTISADVNKAKNKRVGFVVKTPVATASVRGTQFDMGTDSISVSRGNVGFGSNSTQGAVVSVTAGNASAVTSTGNTVPPSIARIDTALGTNSAEKEIPAVASVAAAAAAAGKKAKSSAPTADVTVTFRP